MSREHGRWWWRLALASSLLLAGLGTWFWSPGLVPSTYSVMGTWTPDPGSGSGGGSGGGSGLRGATELTGSQGDPDVLAVLEARQERFSLATGETVDGYTLAGTSPGPALTVVQGDLLQVTLRNVDVPGGVTLHWHGLEVPHAEDGVAGVTQDAVPPGGEHVYRFVAEDAGTYWYHSRNASHAQVTGGLFGTLVVLPRDVAAPAVDAVDHDVVAAVHTYDGLRTVGGRTGTTFVPAADGDRVRVRLVDTDDRPLAAWVSGSAFRVLAVDGTDVHRPPPVRGEHVRVAAGGRVDLEVTAPARVDVGGGVAVVVGSGVPAEARPGPALDLLTYGAPAPLGFDPTTPDRTFRHDFGRASGLRDGPPVLSVEEGDLVHVTLGNQSGAAHAIHLHGHQAVVLSRDGEPASGSPWVVDSLVVAAGETYDVAFVADNPGVWVGHCHDHEHAGGGVVAHLVYAGVTGG